MSIQIFMKSLLFISIIYTTLFNSHQVTGLKWGATGHRVIGKLASNMISKHTASKINELLDGVSLAQISTFADEIKSDKRYRTYNAWHYANINDDETYVKSKKNEKGDIVKAINTCIDVLKSSTSERSKKQFYLKLLVHFVGDVHQPMHLARYSDRGGNNIKIKWFGDNSNLHRVWDSNMIDQYGMSYTEITQNLPKLKTSEISEIANATLLTWVNESQDLAKHIYKTLPENINLDYLYQYDHFNTVRMQLLKGGIRLAALLDEIFK